MAEITGFKPVEQDTLPSMLHLDLEDARLPHILNNFSLIAEKQNKLGQRAQVTSSRNGAYSSHPSRVFSCFLSIEDKQKSATIQVKPSP